MIQRMCIGRWSLFAAAVLIALAGAPSVGAADSLGTVRGKAFTVQRCFPLPEGQADASPRKLPLERVRILARKDGKVVAARRTRRSGAFVFRLRPGFYSFSSRAASLAPVMVLLRPGAVRRIELDDGERYPDYGW